MDKLNGRRVALMIKAGWCECLMSVGHEKHWKYLKSIEQQWTYLEGDLKSSQFLGIAEDIFYFPIRDPPCGESIGNMFYVVKIFQENTRFFFDTFCGIYIYIHIHIIVNFWLAAIPGVQPQAAVRLQFSKSSWARDDHLSLQTSSGVVGRYVAEVPAVSLGVRKHQGVGICMTCWWPS